MKAPLEHYPGMNRFVLDWMGGDTRFLPRGGGQAIPPVRTGRIACPPQLIAALDASTRHWGIFAKDQLQRWAEGDTFTVIAGQQVGFAGGPLYTLAKLVTLVKMKRASEAKGIPATAFFWLATDAYDSGEDAEAKQYEAWSDDLAGRADMMLEAEGNDDNAITALRDAYDSRVVDEMAGSPA
jgi:hypothetical protein